jgi:CRISPR-associated endonuclease Csn1
VERDGGPREIMRVIKFTQNGQMALAARNEAGSWPTGTGRRRSAQDHQPHRFGPAQDESAPDRIDPLGRVFDPGPRE